MTDSYDYDAWGILVASTGSTPNTGLYAWEEFDPDLALINLRARQYKPGMGRFITSDPLDILGQALPPLQVADVVQAPYLRALFELVGGGSARAETIKRLSGPASLHRYAYANGDPVDLVDPSGLMAAEYGTVAKIRAAVASAVARLGRVAACEFEFMLHMLICASLEANGAHPVWVEDCMNDAAAMYYACKGGGRVPPPGGYWN